MRDPPRGHKPKYSAVDHNARYRTDADRHVEILRSTSRRRNRSEGLRPGRFRTRCGGVSVRCSRRLRARDVQRLGAKANQAIGVTENLMDACSLFLTLIPPTSTIPSAST